MNKFICRIALVLWLPAVAAVGEDIHYRPVSRDVIQARLGRYAGKDKQREETLKQMFKEAGCDDPHLTEQSVKGSKLPNLICVLPGNSENSVIVGAHFDHVDAGAGVVDNWSGSSLLSSLYEAVKGTGDVPHVHLFSVAPDSSKGIRVGRPCSSRVC